MNENQEFGQKGEAIAAKFLTENHHEILELNWRHKHLEGDIIAIDQKSKELVIVEVKTRRSNIMGEPEEWVGKAKQKNLVQLAGHYLEYKNLDLEVRFDIISIISNGKQQKINHIKDAFYPLV
jgi:putative endonuclease